MNTDNTSVARLAQDEVRDVLAAADATPWPDVDRPWWFRCTRAAIELHTGDLTQPCRLLACGRALLNLRLAVQSLGVYADVRLVPDPDVRTLLAQLRPEHERLATTRDRQLALAGVRPDSPATRHARLSPAVALPELRRAAELEQAWLAPLSDTQVTQLGLNRYGARLLVVVGTLQDDVRSLLRAGQAVQRVALTAVTFGLATDLVLEPAPDPETLRKVIGGALSPHAVLAVGRPVGKRRTRR